jgi:hypothetical protein
MQYTRNFARLLRRLQHTECPPTTPNTVQACQTEMLKVEINYFNEAQISDRKHKSAYPASLVFLSPLKGNNLQYMHIKIQSMLQTKHSLLPLRNTNLRILYRKIMVVYRVNHMEHMHCEGKLLFSTKPLSACKGDFVQRLGRLTWD